MPPQPSVLGLNKGWTTAEFNVFGNFDGSNAAVNPGATIVVQLLTNSATPTTVAPICNPEGFTGETTNFDLVLGSCSAFGGASPGIQFTEITPPLPNCQVSQVCTYNTSPPLVSVTCPEVLDFYTFDSAGVTPLGDYTTYSLPSETTSSRTLVACPHGTPDPYPAAFALECQEISLYVPQNRWCGGPPPPPQCGRKPTQKCASGWECCPDGEGDVSWTCGVCE